MSEQYTAIATWSVNYPNGPMGPLVRRVNAEQLKRSLLQAGVNPDFEDYLDLAGFGAAVKEALETEER